MKTLRPLATMMHQGWISNPMKTNDICWGEREEEGEGEGEGKREREGEGEREMLSYHLNSWPGLLQVASQTQ